MYMDRQTTTLNLLARFPDVSTVRPERIGGKVPPSRGRVIGQALSFKVLAVAAVLLVGIAIVLNRSGPSSESSTATTSLPQWHSESPAPSANAAPVWVTPLAQTPAATPAPTAPPATPGIPPQPTLANEPSAMTAAVGPLMSQWPNPAYPTAPQIDSGVDESHADANQSMAIRPAEQTRSNYDRSRPSIY